MGREALGHTREEIEPSESLCPSRIPAGWEAVTGIKPACPAKGPGEVVALPVHRHKPVRQGLLLGVEQVCL